MADISPASTSHPQEDVLTAYCFGDLEPAERAEVERHFLVCDTCFAQAERLMAAVGALAHESSATEGLLTRADVISLLGISGGLAEPLAGHGWFVGIATAAYGFLSAESVLTELSYFFDRFGAVASWFVPFTFVWVSLALLASFFLIVQRVRTDRDNGLLASVAVFAAGIAVFLAAAQYALPHEPSIQAQLVPRTVAQATLRNFVLYGTPLAVVFLLVPFHFVIALQRELARGRHENVLALIRREQLAVAPRGTVFIPPFVLGALIIIAVIYLTVANQYLLDQLTPGRFSELFSFFIYVRIGAGLLLAGGSLAWYFRMLNEAKREAIAARAPDGPPVVH